MKKLLAVLVFAALGAGVAQANSITPVYYGLASAGNSQLSGAQPGLNKNAAIYQVGVGAQFDRNFGAEISYVRSNRNMVVGGMASNVLIEGISLVGTGAYPLATDLDATAKLGVSNMWAKSMGTTQTSLRPLIGVGAEYRINSVVSLTADYTLHSKVAGMNSNLEAISVGLKHRF